MARIDEGATEVFLRTLSFFRYPKPMADGKPIDPLASSEQEIEVDAETAAAIERGIRAADEGRVVSAEEVRKLTQKWISKLSTPSRR